MSVDREYKIRISTVTDGDPGKTADSLKKVGKAAEDSAEGVTLLEFKGLEFRKLIGELDRIMPGVGTALRAAFNPATLGLGVLVLLIEKVKEGLAEYNKKLDEIGEAAAKADFAASIEAAAEATRTAISEQEKYLANLHEIEKGERGITADLNNQLQLIAAIEAAKQQAAEAQHTLDLARVKGQEISGAISPTQAALEKQRIEDQYTRDKRAAEERKFQEEQNARTAAADEAANKQHELDKKQTDSANALSAAQSKKASAVGAIPKQEDIDAAGKAMDEANKKADHDRPEAERFKHNDILAKRAQESQFEADRAKNTFDLLEELRKRGDDAKKRDLTPLETAAEQAKKEAEANAKAEAAASQARDKAQREHDAAANDRGATDRSTISTDAANTRSELMTRARALQKEFENQGAGMDHRDMAELLQLIRMLGETFLEQGQNKVSKQELQRELQALRRLIESKGK